MLKPSHLAESLLLDLGTTLLDAEMPGAGALVRAVSVGTVFSRLRDRVAEGSASFEKRLVARLSHTAHEYRDVNDGDVGAVTTTAALLLRGAPLDARQFYAEHGGRAAGAATALIKRRGPTVGIPPEPRLQALLHDLLCAWFETSSEGPLDAPALERSFRTEVLDQLAALERRGEALEKDARDLRNLLDGRAILPIPYYARPAPGELAPSALLDPRYAIVPFAAREDSLGELLEWCRAKDGPPLAIALVHGAGGRGKTRLMLELAQALYRAEGDAHPWNASGLLDLEASSLPAEQLGRLFRSSKRVFVGIDRAERNVDAVEHVLREAYRVRSGRHIRVVLAARSDGEWFAALRSRSAEISQVIGAPATRVIALPPLALDLDTRRTRYREAHDAFAELLEPVAPADSVATSPPALGATHLDEVLALHMSALA